MATANARLELETQNESSQLVGARWAMYVALGAAWVAMCGSLYMSEALGWLPCLWCWYQRIFMYPTAIILAVGLATRDRNTPKFALALTIPGACASIYHILLQKVPEFARFETCTAGVPCTADYLNWMGFVTIPMLALTAFVIIIVCCVIAVRAQANGDNALADGPGSIFAPLPSVLLIVLTLTALFGVIGTIVKGSRPATTISSITQSPSGSASLEQAATIYTQSCAQCHGPANSGMLLMRADYLKNASDLQLMAMIRAGRAANALDNTSGKAMPANGGRVSLSDEELLGLVKYLRQAKGV
jgi:disulfide bond formation protein DsbB